MTGGHVRIELSCADGEVRGVTVHLQRPDAARMLRGLAPEQAVALVPRLYSVCGSAQHIAARRALEAARGIAPSRAEEAERDARVLRECAQEHLWRLLLDWPRQLGMPPAERTFVTWHRRLSEETAEHWSEDARCFVRDELLGMPGETWAALDGDGLERWLGAAQGLAAAILASLPPEPPVALAGIETTALTRQQSRPAVLWAQARHGWGTFARVVARIVEVVDCLTQINPPAWCASKNEPPALDGAAAGRGSASVETARGRLVHEVALDAAGRVERYRVVAPTDVNFQAEGPCERALAALRAARPEAAVAAAHRVVLGFDPCVPWQVGVRTA
jgi:coenzyme F420-reducing hydrogenase alpha subunit